MTRPRRMQSPALESAIDGAFGVLLSLAKDGVESGALTDAPPVDHALRVYVFAYGFASLYLLGRLRVRPAATESYLRSLIAPLVATLVRALAKWFLDVPTGRSTIDVTTGYIAPAAREVRSCAHPSCRSPRT